LFLNPSTLNTRRHQPSDILTHTKSLNCQQNCCGNFKCGIVESCHIHITDPRIMACRLRDRISEQYQDIGKILSETSWAFVMCINMTCLTGTVFGGSDYGTVDVNPADGVGLYPQLGCAFICKFSPCGACARLPPLPSH